MGKYLQISNPVGGIRKIDIDPDSTVDFPTFLEQCVNIMKTEQNSGFFKTSMVKIGSFQGQEFYRTDEAKENWNMNDFLSKMKVRNGTRHFYLITEQMDSTNQISSTKESPKKIEKVSYYKYSFLTLCISF